MGRPQLAAGEPAPSFELVGAGGTGVTHEDFVGRVHLLIYFMRAFNCIASRGNVRKLAGSRLLEQSGCELLAVAPGPWDEAERFAQQVAGDALIMADPAETFHTELGFPRGMFGLVQASGALLIDRDGVVRFCSYSMNPGHAVEMDDLHQALHALGQCDEEDAK